MNTPSAPSAWRAALADLKVLRPYLARHDRVLPAIIVLGLLASLAESLGASLVVLFLYAAMGRTAEALAAGGAIGSLFQHVIRHVAEPVLLAPLVVGIIGLKALFTALYTMLSSSVQSRLGEDVRNALHWRYLEVEYDYIRTRPEGEMLNVLAAESWSVSQAYQTLTRMVINLIRVLVMTAFVALISWPITIAAVLGGGALFTVLNLASGPARRLSRRATEVSQEMAARTLQTLESMRTIRAYGQERQHQELFQLSSSRVRQVALRAEHMFAWVSSGSELGYLALLVGLAFTGEAFAVPFASTLAAAVILYRLQGPLWELQSSVLRLAQLSTPLNSVAQVLERTGKAFVQTGEQPFDGLRRSIEFRNVGFRYAGAVRDALDDVSFTIPAGKTTALVGPSGAGKTTIANLLLRVDPQERGEILVDGTPIGRLKRDDWLQRIAIAGQDIDLLDSSIGANIRISRPEATEEEVRDAARLADILDYIDGLPYRMEEWIGPKAANVSGGQRQRLGLARAFLRDPDILILDEATSALDALTAERIRTGVRERFAGRTILIITHRLRSVADADHIIWIEGGQVTESGRPEDLLARSSSALRRMMEITDREDARGGVLSGER